MKHKGSLEVKNDKPFHKNSLTGTANTVDDVQREEDDSNQEPQYDAVKVAGTSVDTVKFVRNVAYESGVQTTLVENVAYGSRNEVHSTIDAFNLSY